MRLPDWLDPLYEAGEMRACDSWAIEEQGVASLDLMERAGAGLVRATAEVARSGPIRVVAGKGNNGGDGLVVARLLREDGYEVDVLATGELDELRGDARANLERLPGARPEPFDPARLEGSGAIVDAMLGTGFGGSPREPIAGAIAAINHQDAPVVACDVPSGVNASTGEVEGEAVRARVTATFHGSKIGLHVAPGAFHAGEVRVIEIGIPRGAPEPAVAGGARGLTGAPTMVALAAARAGAGYVQVAIPESVETVLELRLLEQMTKGLPDEDGAHVPDGVEGVKQLAERAGAVVLGPGLGRTDGAMEFARRVAREVEAPLVIDADGLNAHAGDVESLRERPGPTVLTPHAGELGRLLEVESDEVNAHRLTLARDAAERSGTIVLLKGDDSLVAKPGGPVAVSPGASPALATAGTGDVLSGVIATFLAKGLGAFEAAAAGVLAHARAGQEAARRLGADHVVAGDVIDALPAALFGP